MLKNTGVAGRPEEYFEAKRDTGVPPHPGDYLDQLPRTGAGIRDDDTPPHAPPHSSLQGLSGYRQHLERTFRLGSTDNGVFATKLMWRHLPELQALAGELPEYAGLQPVELLTVLFGDPRYVLVSRRDKVRQAVSMWRALQTRSWRLEHGPRAKNPAELQYRFGGRRSRPSVKPTRCRTNGSRRTIVTARSETRTRAGPRPRPSDPDPSFPADAAEHPLSQLARHRPLRAAIRQRDPDSEHPVAGRSGRDVPQRLLRGALLLGQPRGALDRRVLP